MKVKIRIFALVMCMILLMTAIPLQASEISDNSNKLLYIVDSNKLSTLENELSTPSIVIDSNKPEGFYGDDADISDSISINFSLFDYISNTEVTPEIIMQYKGVALPFNKSYTEQYARYAYNSGKLVYIYGELTIAEYKNILGITDFSITTQAYNPNETQSINVTQNLDVQYEKTAIYNVISYSNNALLCKFGNTVKEINYLVAAVKNCDNTNIPVGRATIVQSEFDFVTYWGGNNQYSVHLDYTLYRELDEIDPTYDYFAIKTTTWVEAGSKDVDEIRTKYELPYSTIDNFLETGPASQSSIGTLNVSCGFGTSGINGSISYSLNLSDQKPTIERTEDFSDEVIEWVMTPRFLFPKSINDAHLVCVATWASTDRYAGIDVFYQGVLENGSNSAYTKIPIRFSYGE